MAKSDLFQRAPATGGGTTTAGANIVPVLMVPSGTTTMTTTTTTTTTTNGGQKGLVDQQRIQLPFVNAATFIPGAAAPLGGGAAGLATASFGAADPSMLQQIMTTVSTTTTHTASPVDTVTAVTQKQAQTPVCISTTPMTPTATMIKQENDVSNKLGESAMVASLLNPGILGLKHPLAGQVPGTASDASALFAAAAAAAAAGATLPGTVFQPSVGGVAHPFHRVLRPRMMPSVQMNPQQQQQMLLQQRRRAKLLSSKYYGVSWHQRHRKWVARCRLFGDLYHLGSYDSEQLAAVVIDLKILQVAQRMRERGLINNEAKNRKINRALSGLNFSEKEREMLKEQYPKEIAAALAMAKHVSVPRKVLKLPVVSNLPPPGTQNQEMMMKMAAAAVPPPPQQAQSTTMPTTTTSEDSTAAAALSNITRLASVAASIASVASSKPTRKSARKTSVKGDDDNGSTSVQQRHRRKDLKSTGSSVTTTGSVASRKSSRPGSSTSSVTTQDENVIQKPISGFSTKKESRKRKLTSQPSLDQKSKSKRLGL